MRSAIKKKITVIVASVVAAAALAAAGGSLAFLAKNTESRANSFTFGNISIKLEEPGWEELPPESKIVYPECEVKKDPQVVNEGKNDLYAYIEVKIPVRTVKTVGENNELIEAAEHELLSYTVGKGWEQLGNDKKTDDGKYTVRLYAYTEKVLKPGEKTPPLFESVKFLNAAEGEPNGETTFDMPVTAYAIQSDYVDETDGTALEKMSAAFEKYKTEMDN